MSCELGSSGKLDVAVLGERVLQAAITQGVLSSCQAGDTLQQGGLQDVAAGSALVAGVDSS